MDFPLSMSQQNFECFNGLSLQYVLKVLMVYPPVCSEGFNGLSLRMFCNVLKVSMFCPPCFEDFNGLSPQYILQYF